MSETAGAVEWSVASRPAAGHADTGDFVYVREHEGGAFIAVADILGHGTEAAAAARRFLDVIAVEPIADLEALFARCDKLLRGDCGAVMTAALVRVRERQVRYLGVGNVHAVVVRARDPAARDWFLVRLGVVGAGLGTLAVRTLAFEPGDVIVFATDGIHAAYGPSIDPLDAVDRIAHRVLDAHATGKDDALVLAARIRDRMAS